MSIKIRAVAFGIFFGIFLASFMIGTTYKMSDDETNAFVNDFQNANAGIDATGIFLHNASIALAMFVPAFGAGWGSFTGWQTGAGFNAIISLNPTPSTSISPLALIFLSPFGVMELVAYSIGMSRSYLLIWRIIRKNPLQKEIIPTALEIGIVIALLLIGGYVESSMVGHQGQSSSG